MAAKGYTTKALVAAELGRTFTGAQDTQCDGLIEEAEAFIDRMTGRAWLVTSAVTDEVHTPVDGVVYLDRAPILSVTAVKVRSRSIGATDTSLVAGSTYELLDLSRGIVSVGDYGDDVIVKVSYTHTSPLPVPKDVQRAATLLVAGWMLPRLDPAMANIESVSVGQGDVSVKYRTAAVQDYEDRATELLANYKRLVFA